MTAQAVTVEEAAQALRVVSQFLAQQGVALPQAQQLPTPSMKRILDPDSPVSERQLAFMQKIAGELGINFDVDPSKFTKGEAGSWIDKHLPAFNQLQAAKKGSVL